MDLHPERGGILLRCEACGTPSRLRLPTNGSTTPCAHCGSEIGVRRVHPLGDAELALALRGSPIPIVADFHAEWCAPCKWLDPVLDDLASRSEGRFLVVKVDTDASPEAAREHRIGSVPTVVLFEGGREADRSIGVEPERLRAWVGLDDGSGEADDGQA